MTACGTCGYEITPCELRGTTCGCAWGDAFSAVASVGRGDLAVLFSVRPSSNDSWVRDLWDREAVVLTETPWPERWNAADADPIEDIRRLCGVFGDMTKSPPRSSVDDVRRAIEDVKRAYELQATQLFYGQRLTDEDFSHLDKLEALPPAPAGKRYGPYDADPHTKGRRRRFRTQRKA